jgi:hypothetical protein
MVDSLTGAIMDVDLCTAVNRQLVLTLFAKGTPPFEGKVVGLPDELKPIVKVLINQEEPFDTTVTILNTDIWKENGQQISNISGLRKVDRPRRSRRSHFVRFFR